MNKIAVRKVGTQSLSDDEFDKVAQRRANAYHRPTHDEMLDLVSKEWAEAEEEAAFMLDNGFEGLGRQDFFDIMQAGGAEKYQDVYHAEIAPMSAPERQLRMAVYLADALYLASLDGDES